MTLRFQLQYPWPRDPKRCGICNERFTEEWMAARCAAQGRPRPLYRLYDVLAFRSGKLAICTMVRVHHALGVKCHVEGPCPHDITYGGHFLRADHDRVERAWKIESNSWLHFKPGLERVATLYGSWLVIPESGPPERYLVGGDPQAEWQELWLRYPARPHQGRRAGRRML